MEDHLELVTNLMVIPTQWWQRASDNPHYCSTSWYKTHHAAIVMEKLSKLKCKTKHLKSGHLETMSFVCNIQQLIFKKKYEHTHKKKREQSLKLLLFFVTCIINMQCNTFQLWNHSLQDLCSYQLASVKHHLGHRICLTSLCILFTCYWGA